MHVDVPGPDRAEASVRLRSGAGEVCQLGRFVPRAEGIAHLEHEVGLDRVGAAGECCAHVDQADPRSRHPTGSAASAAPRGGRRAGGRAGRARRRSSRPSRCRAGSARARPRPAPLRRSPRRRPPFRWSCRSPTSARGGRSRIRRRRRRARAGRIGSSRRREEPRASSAATSRGTGSAFPGAGSRVPPQSGGNASSASSASTKPDRAARSCGAANPWRPFCTETSPAIDARP